MSVENIRASTLVDSMQRRTSKCQILLRNLNKSKIVKSDITVKQLNSDKGVKHENTLCV